jgi:hypothetical protein
MEPVNDDDLFLAAPLPEQPDLVTTPDGIAFVFPNQVDRIARRHQSEFRGMVRGFALIAPVVIGAAWYFVGRPDLLPPEVSFQPIWIAIGATGLMAAAGALLYWQWRRMPHALHAKLDGVLLAIEVKESCVRRIFASDRIESWSRAEIKTIAVERFRDGDSDGSWDAYRLMIERRHDASVHLFGYVKEQKDRRRVQMLEWIALHLRQALQVPYEHVPQPSAGCVKQAALGEIEIRVPFVRPEDKWRRGISDMLWGMGMIVGFLLFAILILQIS